jgi:hypothetical protein
MISISGWAIIDDARDESLTNSIRAAQWQRRPQRMEISGEAAQKKLLDAISQLAPDWDGGGASAIDEAATANARTLLQTLWSIGRAPGSVLPSAAGTIQFDWEDQFGSAHLEIGNTSFGFYTDPIVGESFLRDGSFEVIDVEEIGVALATIAPASMGESLVHWDNPLGVARRYAAGAA